MNVDTDTTKLIINFAVLQRCLKCLQWSRLWGRRRRKKERERQTDKGGRGNLTMFHILPTHYCKHKNGDEQKLHITNGVRVL
jgi:hypothetical protein